MIGTDRRVLMFGWEFPPYNSGGLGVACLGLVRALSKQGTRITFVLPRKLPTHSPYARIVFADMDDSVTGYAVDSPLEGYINTRSYLRATHGHPVYGSNLLEEIYRYASRVEPIARAEPFDLIYAHDWLSFPAGLEAQRATNKPLIVHVHSTEFDRCGGSVGINEEVYAIEKRGMEAADCVIAVSQFTKNIIIERYGIPESKVSVVHNGIDEETVPQAGSGRLRLAALKEAGYSLVLFLGRITLQKGPDYFLRAARRVVKRNPRVAFILSGSGDMERQMMELSAQLGIAHNVFFSGFLRDAELYEAYRLADLFVMPSVSEPFGITSLEAMKIGTPVLISKQSGVSEAVRHALKTDFWDVEDMANKILSVVSYAPLRKSLAENGAREAESLTWDSAARRIDAIVRALVH